ncbi:MAG: hypothetical protein HUJ76_13370, partial [Parasporobacterium sp.]|nr:hypothetical protein [Parasporobacterium sp.]
TENPVNNLTVSDIRDIYCSETPCWSDYADYDRPANTYQLEENNGSQTAFRNIVDGNELGEHHREVQGMQEIIDCVADDSGGICYAFLMYFQERHNRDECRTVKVNGFGVDSPEYPLQYEVFLISREDNDDVRVKDLINEVSEISIVKYLF